ncbi:hypothetical protein ACFSTC_55590 [Nonomuraea ferruginea]
MAAPRARSAPPCGLQVDLRVVHQDSWGAALQYFTGSKPHNIHTREIALHQKLKLSEYGLFDVETGERIVSADEGRSTTGSACHGSRRRFGRTAARSRPRSGENCPCWSARPTSAATCTPTLISPMGWRRWRRWSRRRPSAATATTR